MMPGGTLMRVSHFAIPAIAVVSFFALRGGGVGLGPGWGSSFSFP